MTGNMNDLVVINDDTQKVTTSSLKVAEVFGKAHKNVMQSIDQLVCSDVFRELNFQLSSYKAIGQHRSYPMFEMTKDGFTMLAMSFNGKSVAPFKEGYIAAFNAMERSPQQPLQLSRMDILKLALESEQKLLEAQEELTIAQPKVEAFDALMNSKGLFTFTQVANALSFSSGIMLTRHLREIGYLSKTKKAGRPTNNPRKKYQKYFVSKLVTVGATNQAFMQTKVTPYGLEQLRQELFNIH